MEAHERETGSGTEHYRLIANVKRGVASDFDELCASYPTMDAAREAAQSLTGRERIGHVLIARDDVPPVFVEWVM
jgi:hypothetical protein